MTEERPRPWSWRWRKLRRLQPCGVDEGFGVCSRPRGHVEGRRHAVFIGGGPRAGGGREVWFWFGTELAPGFGDRWGGPLSWPGWRVRR